MKQPTIHDVATRAGVSKSLVSLAMTDPARVGKASREAIRKAADDLGYRPNAVARSLVRQQTGVIGIIVSDLHNPFFADVTDGVETTASEHGYRSILSSGFLRPNRERGAITMMLELRVDGLVVIGSMLPVSKIEEYAKTLPVTLVSRSTRSKHLDSIGVDDAAGTQVAVAHLASLGHERILHIHAGSAAGAPRRRDGYERGMREHGLHRFIRTIEGGFSRRAGRRAMEEILESDDLPTAVIAPNDTAALGAMEVLDIAGIDVPGQVSLVGYDDLALAGIPRISLTTVGQPRLDFGRTAARLVLERLADKRDTARHIVVPPRLVVRSSTGPPAPRTR